MWNMPIASSLFVVFVVICFVTCEDGCEINRVENGEVLKADFIPITNSSGHEIGTQAIYLQANTSSSVDSGSSIYIRCRNPYRFQGDRTRVLAEITCTNGRFVPFPVCLRPPCDKRSLKHPGLDKGGERTFFHGESFVPKCLQGYKVAEKADKRIHCENGRWTGNLPPCTKEVQCKLPEKPDFGSVKLIGNSATVGSVVIFSCDTGRKLMGSFVSTCNNSGEWTTPTPKCIAACKTEALLDFEGLLLENRRTLDDGEWFQARCDQGFEVSSKDNPKIYCRDGKWIGSFPPCSSVQKTQCNTKSLLDFEGLIAESGGTLNDGEWFQPVCDEGFEVANKTDTKIYCRDGKWEGNIPPCSETEKAQCNIESLPDFEGFVAESGRTLNDGEWFQPVCDEGFEVADKNDTNIYCSEGEWQGNIPPCFKSENETCTVPSVANGELGKYVDEFTRTEWRTVFKMVPTGMALGEKEEVVLKCNTNYMSKSQHQGENTITCQRGRLSPEPECVTSECLGDPPPTENGIAVVTARHHGYGIWYHCDRGFMKQKFGIVRCVYGSWVGKAAACKDTRCDKSSLNYTGLVRSEGLLSSGQSFMPTCLPRYEVTENSDKKIHCRDGSWSGNLPPCIGAQCRTEDLQGFSGLVLGSSGAVDDGNWLQPTCTEGYELNNKLDSKVYCRLGLWQGNLPPCSPAPCSRNPPVPENGKMKSLRTVGHGSSVKYECFPFHEIEGKGSVVCNYGRWIGSLPTCRDTRCYLRNLSEKEGVNLTRDAPVHSTHKANIACIIGYSLRYHEVYCENGVWRTENALSPCQEDECEVKQISNGKILKERIIAIRNWYGSKIGTERVREPADIGSFEGSGTVLYVECNGRYKFQGAEAEEQVRIICRRGQWTPLPVCLL